MITRCLICNEEGINTTGVPHDDSTVYDCPICGRYAFTIEAHQMLIPQVEDNAYKRAVLSHYVWRSQSSGQVVKIYSDVLERVISNKLPNAAEQANNFILWLGNNSDAPGSIVERSIRSLEPIIGALGKDGVTFVLISLENKGLIGTASSFDDSVELSLRFDGWKYFEELHCGHLDSQKAFMAMEYGHITINKAYLECFKPAVHQAGFELVRLDEKPKAGLIDDRLRVEIMTSTFIVVDLTYDNNGAYWEAGYADGLDKPVIYTCKKSYFKKKSGTHFDTNHHQTVLWENDNYSDAMEELKSIIRATLPEQAKMQDD